MKQQKPWPCGPMSPGKPGRHYQLPPLNLPKPDYWCAASQPNALPGTLAPRPYIRAGADHRHILSKGWA
jgi:hypothetical protein